MMKSHRVISNIVRVVFSFFSFCLLRSIFFLRLNQSIKSTRIIFLSELIYCTAEQAHKKVESGQNFKHTPLPFHGTFLNTQHLSLRSLSHTDNSTPRNHAVKKKIILNSKTLLQCPCPALQNGYAVEHT
jgi:hypothetical protein